MGTAQAPMYEWEDLPWQRIERAVFKLQKRIYRAAQRGDTKTVHRLQRLLIKSRSAKLLATRRVTQDNQGKKTAGVDGVKALTPAQRLTLAKGLTVTAKAQPVRRVWIPKPGTTEQRGLGIPVMQDRAAQALAKLALEPAWEARFEPNSYGFRPGRSCHDAIEALFNAIRCKAKFVLDADIAKCFDRIDHRALLEKLQTSPTLRRAIRGWLRAGVMDGPTLYPTTAGSPQGGVISPLLANIALHGLEQAITTSLSARQSRERRQPIVVRYADDFVVLHQDREVVEQCRVAAQEWLAGIGLELKPSKTRIVHTLDALEGHEGPGFDFLGFHVRQYHTGRTRTAYNTNGMPLGFQTLICPSKESIWRHTQQLDTLLRRYRAAPQAALIAHLNPLVRGWTRYFSTTAASHTFRRLHCVLYQKLRSWAGRRHPNKPWRWIVGKYWRSETTKWRFAVKDGPRLYQHSQTPIRRHVKVSGRRSPFDGDWAYWGRRLGRYPDLPRRVVTLLRWQDGNCARCGLPFRAGDLPVVGHIVPLSQGGKDRYLNWQLVHHVCHAVQFAAADAALARGSLSKGSATEEPDEVKVSCPVL